jgi:hypothetical protein
MRYGGTMDLVMELDGQAHVVDYKTGKSVRRKTILQLAAYRHLWNTSGRTPKISSGAIVHSPLGGPLKCHPVSQTQLDQASPLFGALLGCYNALQTLTLEKGVTNEDV